MATKTKVSRSRAAAKPSSKHKSLTKKRIATTKGRSATNDAASAKHTSAKCAPRNSAWTVTLHKIKADLRASVGVAAERAGMNQGEWISDRLWTVVHAELGDTGRGDIGKTEYATAVVELQHQLDEIARAIIALTGAMEAALPAPNKVPFDANGHGNGRTHLHSGGWPIPSSLE